MITPQYIRVMARYNSEMNRRIYAGAEQLTDEQRRADVGLFWKSLHGIFRGREAPTGEKQVHRYLPKIDHDPSPSQL